MSNLMKNRVTERPWSDLTVKSTQNYSNGHFPYYCSLYHLARALDAWRDREEEINLLRSQELIEGDRTQFSRALLLMQFSARTRIAKRNMSSIDRHFIYSKPALSALFFSVIERSVLMALVCYYKDMLGKVTMQRSQQFSAFSLLPKEPS